MRPLVSIITPSYNQGRYIRETIESVLAQDYENIEYIIIDGGSTDNTLDILAEYSNQLIYISEPDNGQSNAINKGFKMASGEIVAWLNSDDVYEPGCVSTAVEAFEKNKKLSLVYGDGYILDEKGSKVRVFEHTQPFDYWKLISFWDYIMQPTTFFRSEAIAQICYLDENLEYCMDWDLWIRLASVGEVEYVNKLMACSREYDETKTSTGGKKRLQEIKGLIYKYSRETSPPGVRMYAASTFYTMHSSNYFLKKVLGRGLTIIHRFLIDSIPCMSEDGWIGNKYSQVIPNYVERVKLIIDVPEDVLCSQQIRVLMNDRVLQTVTIDKSERCVVEIQNEDKRYSQLTLMCKNCKRIHKRSRKPVGARLLTVEYI